MAKTKLHTFYQNPFYDDLFGSYGVVVPSKRIRYKQNERKEITEIIAPRGTHEFEEYIKSSFTTNPNWPRKGRLLIAIRLAITHADYRIKDIDNVTKSILDALKGVAYIDDVQIDSVHVVKWPSDKYGFMIGIKELSNTEDGWNFPLLYSEKPFNREQEEIARKKKRDSK